MLRLLSIVICKIEIWLGTFKQSLRKWHLKNYYNGRFAYGENFSLQSTSKLIIGINQSSIVFGSDVKIRDNCFFRSEQNGRLIIGNDVFFNNGCSLNCLGVISIGNNCQFGEGVKLYDHNHAYADNTVLVKEQGYIVGKISVGNNCWVGSGVIILKDVVIGDNVVIGAGCIIHKSIPAGTVLYNDQYLKTK
jgi:acetyltransferase-like isoleucine patch superfamily enzyme